MRDIIKRNRPKKRRIGIITDKNYFLGIDAIFNIRTYNDYVTFYRDGVMEFRCNRIHNNTAYLMCLVGNLIPDKNNLEAYTREYYGEITS